MTIGERSRGPQNPKARLSDDDVREIRRLAVGGVTQRDLAAQYGVDQSLISRIVTRRRWAHLE